MFDLKPVWLISPLSVSDTLPLRPDAFDVVIFDEASQITLESAVPSIFRAPQAIVVGDEMQLPPTDFFSARADVQDEEGLRVGDGGQVFEYDLAEQLPEPRGEEPVVPDARLALPQPLRCRSSASRTGPSTRAGC